MLLMLLLMLMLILMLMLMLAGTRPPLLHPCKPLPSGFYTQGRMNEIVFWSELES